MSDEDHETKAYRTVEQDDHSRDRVLGQILCYFFVHWYNDFRAVIGGYSKVKEPSCTSKSPSTPGYADVRQQLPRQWTVTSSSVSFPRTSCNLNPACSPSSGTRHFLMLGKLANCLPLSLTFTTSHSKPISPLTLRRDCYASFVPSTTPILFTLTGISPSPLESPTPSKQRLPLLYPATRHSLLPAPSADFNLTVVVVHGFYDSPRPLFKCLPWFISRVLGQPTNVRSGAAPFNICSQPSKSARKGFTRSKYSVSPTRHYQCPASHLEPAHTDLPSTEEVLEDEHELEPLVVIWILSLPPRVHPSPERRACHDD
jgi:hypothetical protein